jgi:peptidyl-tRNA hydrolase, PTH2 family
MEIDNTVKMWIIIRTDLNMPKGKMVSQGSHSSQSFIFENCSITEIGDVGKFILETEITKDEYYWIRGGTTKVVLKVGSEEELLDVHSRALELGLTTHLVTDAGLTMFDNIPTHTAVSIGPHSVDKVKDQFKHLKLL